MHQRGGRPFKAVPLLTGGEPALQRAAEALIDERRQRCGHCGASSGELLEGLYPRMPRDPLPPVNQRGEGAAWASEGLATIGDELDK